MKTLVKRLALLLFCLLLVVMAGCAKDEKPDTTPDTTSIANKDDKRRDDTSSQSISDALKITPDPNVTEAPRTTRAPEQTDEPIEETPAPTEYIEETPEPTEDPANTVYIRFPWENGDTEYSQRVKYVYETIEVKGQAPAGSTVTASCASYYATLSKVTVNSEGEYKFTVKMEYPGDYRITITCTVPTGESATREMHVQRAPDYSKYKSQAKEAKYANLLSDSSQALKLEGKITNVLYEQDYVLALMELEDGHSIVLEYHNHYPSAGIIKAGWRFEKIYGRALGINADGVPQVYVWFIDD